MFRVYWTDHEGKAQALYVMGLNKVLKMTEELRREGNTFVTMVSEDPNQIGKPGVDAVEEGVLPNGDEYTWRKRR